MYMRACRDLCIFKLRIRIYRLQVHKSVRALVYMIVSAFRSLYKKKY